MKTFIRTIVRKTGYDIVKYRASSGFDISKSDFSESERAIIASVRPFTMTTDERIISLIRAVDYISHNNIDGAFVECGVWRGGSAMTAAMQLIKQHNVQRDLFLYDTFEGMSAPTGADIEYNGRLASAQLASTPKQTGIWCYASIEDVNENISSTGYPSEHIHLVKGKVEETIPNIMPKQIAILRLDTDWYESTLHELRYLFPLLSPRGVLIVDDYGHWRGCKKAVDEYFSEHPGEYYFHRIDYAARLIMKVPSD